MRLCLGCLLNRGAFNSIYGKRKLGLCLLSAYINEGCPLSRVLFTVNMRRENWGFVYCLLNKGCLLNRGAFYSKYEKRKLGLCLLSA